ncbi:DUF7522 family protein [Halocalculus aciditolerans]|uniref:Uncharacterized protein n=1 Tax=Halocalculus aciditolerans TaxID=1383812 RepID=A0A830FG46_9EURY|nr:hypothetical protein [Halocalculus aciditolerans]GGL52017.1 hypothetical protein GCM10009039_07870 [Halocalculus aciditolerans]
MSDQLLGDGPRDRLVTVARTALGDSLRSATYFTHNDYEQIYLRSDLERDADLMAFIGAEWQDYNVTQGAYSNSELGEYQFTIRAFDNGYLVRITRSDRGVFVTTDGITMQDFRSAAESVDDILGDLAGESRQ